MAYDLEEQDQIDALKAFWNKYGNFLLTVVTVVLVAVAGWRGWQWYEQRQASAASVVYHQLQDAVEKRDVARVREVSGTLFADYSRTAYGQMGALMAARAYFEAGELKAARAPLQWAIDNARDPDFRHLARLRLAGVLLDEKAYDDGLKLLSVTDTGTYAGRYADARGDLLVAHGRRDDARAAYAQALQQLGPASPLRPLVQLKLDALGGA
jgi:predicted negative regulator of RcsB-dependent stress response